ncbi:iron-containing alcohol dehydrogenase [Natronobacterium texcoconense]|uniref:Alcohol dehydrogenase, class IV n=1 Tax=Natronobacterium texcoconense TaxID=1095778 RepID=A0A1H1G568_NATTX|nr:iron-containing alcohol dehydrogenase [Natronobacterium texcoconense]SDR08374.1 Alcohol dehydrogenase, class IV [Natronobacterium texcoconense]
MHGYEFGEPGSTPFRFTTTDTRFGDGVTADLDDVLERYGVSNPLIVTDRGVEDAGLLERVTDGIDAEPIVYYASTEPSTEDFENLPTAAVDGVVAVGGGSCLDTAKLAAVLLAHGGDPADYVGVDAVPGPIAPLIAVPTTSGTGSQATQTAVVTHDGVKRGASDEHLRPDVALVDPELTFGLPRAVTARSGFDAFVHALESLLARDYRWVEPRPITYQGANPVSRSLAWRALVLVHGSLERAVFDGDDREARRAMSLGSHLAGMAFSASGLGAVHALASTVGGMTDRPHGECLGASIRAGLTYNLPVRREEYTAVAAGLGVGSEEPEPEALIAECERLRDSIGLPGSFDEVGLERSDVDEIVENTLVQERRLATNPRTVTDELGEFLLEVELEE